MEKVNGSQGPTKTKTSQARNVPQRDATHRHGPREQAPDVFSGSIANLMVSDKNPCNPVDLSRRK
jgi:hypothetical protein